MSDLEDKIHAALLAMDSPVHPTGVDGRPYDITNLGIFITAFRALDGVDDAIVEIMNQFNKHALDRGAKAAEKTPAQYKDDMIAKIEESSVQKATIIWCALTTLVQGHAEREADDTASSPHGL